MLRLIWILLIIIPVLGFGYTVEQMMSELNLHVSYIRLVQADFRIWTSGTGFTNVQSGKFSYSDTDGTILLYQQPLFMKVEIKKGGEIFVNGDKKKAAQTPGEDGDIYLVSFLKKYNLRIIKETSEELLLAAYGKSMDSPSRSIATIRFNKKLKVVTYIQYRGNGNEYPYEMHVSYTQVGNLPFINRITTDVVAFSVTMRSFYEYSNIIITKKE